MGVPQDEDTGSGGSSCGAATLQAPNGIGFHGARKLQRYANNVFAFVACAARLPRSWRLACHVGGYVNSHKLNVERGTRRYTSIIAAFLRASQSLRENASLTYVTWQAPAK